MHYQFSSVTQSCPTLCSPMNCSTPGLPVHHQLLEFTQTHVHWVGDAIQPSHPLLRPFPPALFSWFDLLPFQETLKSLLQHHSSKTSILWCSAFFTVLLSHPYMTTGKTIALTRRKRLLISWLQSSSAVILEPPNIKSVTVSIVSPSICHQVMGPDAMIFVFWMLSLRQLFHSPLSLSSRGFWVPLQFLP